MRIGQQGADRRGIAEVQPGGVLALGTEEVPWQWDSRVRDGVVRRYDRHRVAHQVGHRDLVVKEAVDERRVGAVLEQPSHEVRQEILVRPDGRVRPHRWKVIELSARLVVEQFTHAVQALEFVLATGAGRDFEHRADGVGIVRGELRVQPRVREQPCGARDVGQVRGRLTRIDRVAGESFDLGALDLVVPIRALDEADHDRPPEPGKPVDHGGGALRIGLHRKPETPPVLEFRFAGKHLEEGEGQLEPFRLLGVDGEVQVARGGLGGEVLGGIVEFGQHPLLLQRLVARMQRGQLDRDPGSTGRRRVGERVADGSDRMQVGVAVAVGVGVCAGTLAEHVEGGEVAVGADQGLLDGPALDEFGAQDAYGLRHRRPGDGFAEATGEAIDPAAHVRRDALAEADGAAGQHQRPGRGVEEHRVRLTDVPRPVGRGDLLRDERLGGVVVRNAQQRLADAHERDALLVGQPELLQEEIENGPLVGPAPAPRDQLPGTVEDPTPLGVAEGHVGEPGTHRVSLVLGPGCGDGGPKSVPARPRRARHYAHPWFRPVDDELLIRLCRR